MTEHADALGLEQRCIRPGHWLIEGHDVVRFGTRSWGRNSIDWAIYEVGATGLFSGPTGRGATPIHMTKTLAEARDWIKDNR